MAGDKIQDKYNKRHRRNLNSYGKRIDNIYRDAIRDAVAIGGIVGDLKPDKMFSFDDYPITRKRVDKLLKGLEKSIETAIINGVEAEWTLANNKNSELSNRVFGKNVGKLTKEQYKRYYSNNDDAREAFIQRKENGLNLSDRVWSYTDQFKEEIEMGLDLGIRSGRSADEMSRDIRSYLKHPDKLFRRVRDEYGQLQLSKRAGAYHPGRGVYRSSYKNARRLAATETNMAYRTADYMRWQSLDFVVGIQIEPSKTNHTPDICDDLAGRYPKDFKWTGWHPHCRCHALTILKTEKEMEADTERILNGEEPLQGSVNEVKSMPDNFTKWVTKNQDSIENAKSLPYWIKDNKKVVDGIIKTRAKKGELASIVDKIKAEGNIDCLPVTRFKEQPSEQQIIERIGGGDLTIGSCSSLAFAYAANKGGLDVLDFRDGKSREFFMSDRNIINIMKKVGGYYGYGEKSGMELLKEYAEIGKEYYLGIGRHVAIVRKTADGKFEYLELQTETQNGWHNLNVNVLKQRFAASGRKSWGEMVEISKLYNDNSYRELMEYINTNVAKQQKGKGGNVK